MIPYETVKEMIKYNLEVPSLTYKILRKTFRELLEIFKEYKDERLDDKLDKISKGGIEDKITQ